MEHSFQWGDDSNSHMYWQHITRRTSAHEESDSSRAEALTPLAL